MPVLDGNVFDFGTFDVRYGVPTLLKVDIPREQRKIVSGQIVIINIYVINVIDPYHKFLFDPEQTPRINIFYPDGTPRVVNGGMTRVNTGIYQWFQQTGVQVDPTVFDPLVFDTAMNDIIGIYTGTFTAQDGSNFMRTHAYELSEVV